MDINWSIVAAAGGLASARAALDQYRSWKAGRSEIPLGWNPRTQAFEPDYRLKRFERWFKFMVWTVLIAHIVIGYNVVLNDWFV